MSEHISELIGARQPFAIWLTDGGIVPPRRRDWRLVAIAKTGKQIVAFVESYKDRDRFYSVNHLQGLEFLGRAWGFQEAHRQYLSINTGFIILANRVDDIVINRTDKLQNAIRILSLRCVCASRVRCASQVSHISLTAFVRGAYACRVV